MIETARYTADGSIIAIFDGQVMTVPDDMGNRHRRELGEWGGVIAPYVPPLPGIPDRVTARQFKLQLLAEDLLDHVEGWVAAQGKAIQLAYDNSGTFARDEPMMQAGFKALGFPPEQIDAFFSAASKR